MNRRELLYGIVFAALLTRTPSAQASEKTPTHIAAKAKSGGLGLTRPE